MRSGGASHRLFRCTKNQQAGSVRQKRVKVRLQTPGFPLKTADTLTEDGLAKACAGSALPPPPACASSLHQQTFGGAASSFARTVRKAGTRAAASPRCTRSRDRRELQPHIECSSTSSPRRRAAVEGRIARGRVGNSGIFRGGFRRANPRLAPRVRPHAVRGPGARTGRIGREVGPAFQRRYRDTPSSNLGVQLVGSRGCD
eukprot:gene8445-biopygen16627